MQSVQRKRASASEAPLPDSNHSRENAVESLGDQRSSVARREGHFLYQNSFFFCRVQGIGDLSGGGCIHVEIVVDRDSGVAFAKVYPAFNALTAADILSTRVLPYFDRNGMKIGEIATPEKSQYFGFVPAHCYENLLSNANIRHVAMAHRGHPHDDSCERFYSFLQKEFFQPALRKTFRVSLEQLQRELDAFLAAYNFKRNALKIKSRVAAPPFADFPFEL